MPLLRRRLPTERLTQRHHRDPQVRVLPHRKQAKVVWRFSDGKSGHDNQSLGLVDALQRRIPIKIYDIPVRPGAGLDWMIGRFPAGSLLCRPFHPSPATGGAACPRWQGGGTDDTGFAKIHV